MTAIKPFHLTKTIFTTKTLILKSQIFPLTETFSFKLETKLLNQAQCEESKIRDKNSWKF